MKTMTKVKVSNAWGVPNQFTITVNGEGTYFQSYNSIIAVTTSKEIMLDENKWDYSNTTGKYRNLFLGENKQETEKKIKTGEYKLVDLN